MPFECQMRVLQDLSAGLDEIYGFSNPNNEPDPANVDPEAVPPDDPAGPSPGAMLATWAVQSTKKPPYSPSRLKPGGRKAKPIPAADILATVDVSYIPGYVDAWDRDPLSDEDFKAGLDVGISKANELLSGDCKNQIEELMINVVKYESEKGGTKLDTESLKALNSYYNAIEVVNSLKKTRDANKFINDTGNTREIAALTSSPTITLFARYFFTIVISVDMTSKRTNYIARDATFMGQTMIEEGVHLIGISDESVGEYLLNKGNVNGKFRDKVTSLKGAQIFRDYIESHCGGHFEL